MKSQSPISDNIVRKNIHQSIQSNRDPITKESPIQPERKAFFEKLLEEKAGIMAIIAIVLNKDRPINTLISPFEVDQGRTISEQEVAFNRAMFEELNAWVRDTLASVNVRSKVRSANSRSTRRSSSQTRSPSRSSVTLEDVKTMVDQMKTQLNTQLNGLRNQINDEMNARITKAVATVANSRSMNNANKQELMANVDAKLETSLARVTKMLNDSVSNLEKNVNTRTNAINDFIRYLAIEQEKKSASVLSGLFVPKTDDAYYQNVVKRYNNSKVKKTVTAAESPQKQPQAAPTRVQSANNNANANVKQRQTLIGA